MAHSAMPLTTAATPSVSVEGGGGEEGGREEGGVAGEGG